MLSKKRIDKKLKKYIKEHLSKGYSKGAIRKVLINHGYDENYIDRLLKRHSELQFVKIYTIFVSLLFIISIFSLNLILPKNQQQRITGFAIKISSGDEGCCTAICQQTIKNECYGKFAQNKKCNELQECNVGCCIDKEGYCLTNYLYGNCISSNGSYINRDCKDIVFCANITDKSYTARLYNIKNKKGSGVSAVKPSAGYYKSSFNILYYIYDKTEVLSLSAKISDNGKFIDSIELYDDGSHNDGAKNDNLYGNNWISSKINNFEGFKRLDVDIVIKYLDGTQQSINKTQSIVLLNNNKCLPIYTKWEPNKKYNIIFAADNYKNLSDGWQKFEDDVQNFLNALFSIDKFLSNKDNFNIYRLEQSLSYFNMQTLISVVSNSCQSYSSKKDLVVVVDNNEQYCFLESSRVVRINPQVLFYKNITNAEVSDIFANFCSYVLTPQKLANEIIIFATPPKIVIHTLDNITYNTSKVNLSFSISALNYPVNNSVFLEGSLILNKITGEESTYSAMLDLKNGTYSVLIGAIDKNRNKAFSQLTLNVTTK